MSDFIAPEPQPSGKAWSLNTLRYKSFVNQKGLCCYCEEEMIFTPLLDDASKQPYAASREHLKTKAKGVKNGDMSVHDASNVAIAHSSCNSKRSDMPWNIWKSICMNEMTHLEAVKFCDDIGIEIPLFKLENRKYKEELENENL
jgi:hypothetical protein